jgi:hypothetical protein
MRRVLEEISMGGHQERNGTQQNGIYIVVTRTLKLLITRILSYCQHEIISKIWRVAPLYPDGTVLS